MLLVQYLIPFFFIAPFPMAKEDLFLWPGMDDVQNKYAETLMRVRIPARNTDPRVMPHLHTSFFIHSFPWRA